MPPAVPAGALPVVSGPAQERAAFDGAGVPFPASARDSSSAIRRTARPAAPEVSPAKSRNDRAVTS